MSQGNAKGGGGGGSSGYSPAVPTNWDTVPSTTTQALDEIAANVPLNYGIRPPAFPVDQSSLTLSVNGIFSKVADFYFDSVTNLVWVTDANNGIINVFDTDLNLISSVNVSTYIDTTTRIRANSTYLLVNHTTGSLNGNYIVIINKSTKTPVGILDGVGAATDFAIDGTGQVWVVDSGNQVVHLFTTGDISNAIIDFPTPQSASGGNFLGTSQPNSICYDSIDNQIWVGTLGHSGNEQLYQMDISGTVLNTYDATGLTSFSFFYSLVHYNGFIWCGTNATSILQVNTSTFTTGSGTDGGAVVEVDISGSNSTKNINIDTFNTTVLVGDTNGKLFRVHAIASPTLASTITVASTGNTEGIGVASSKLFVADQKPHVIEYTGSVGSEIVQGVYSGPIANISWNALIVTDGGLPSPNIRSARGDDQSIVDNTKQGIVNLSSDTSGSTVGAAGNFVTISGGDQNSITADYGSVGGGFGNSVNGQYGFAAGNNNNISGPYCMAIGNGNFGGGQASAAMGVSCVTTGIGCIATGISANAFVDGMRVHSGTNSSGQVMDTVYSCADINAAGTNLFDFANSPLSLRNGYAYMIRARVIAIRQDTFALPSCFEDTLLVHTTGGTLTIDVDNVVTSGTIANGNSYTIAYTAPGGLVLQATFTGASGQTVNASLHYDILERIGTGA